jgi:transcriptional regulator with XRE-family HTH domain
MLLLFWEKHMENEKLELILNDLRNIIRVKRKMKQKTLHEVGKETGISHNYIGLWERGNGDITISKFIKLIDTLDALEEVNLCLKSAMGK